MLFTKFYVNSQFFIIDKCFRFLESNCIFIQNTKMKKITLLKVIPNLESVSLKYAQSCYLAVA